MTKSLPTGLRFGPHVVETPHVSEKWQTRREAGTQSHGTLEVSRATERGAPCERSMRITRTAAVIRGHRLASASSPSAALTAIAVAAPTTAAYATELAVPDNAQVATTAEPALLVQAGKVAASLYPGAHGDLSFLVTNTTERPLTTRARHPPSTPSSRHRPASAVPENFAIAPHCPDLDARPRR